jgi:signal transduction histidine kinase
MNPSSTSVKELLAVYHNYWNAYAAGDVNTVAGCLDEGFTQVGSAESEVFTNKQDAVQFIRDTIDQVAGKVQMRNRKTALEFHEGWVLVHERCDVYVLSEAGWVFYAPFRISTLMEEKGGTWKIVHQHASIPDARTGEGENLAIDKVVEENRELREAVRRRTVELEQTSLELKIESTLEKVRSVAMGMQKPEDMLQICLTICRQLEALDVREIRNIQTAIFFEEKGRYLNYEFYARHNKMLVTDVSYLDHPVHESFARQMMKGPNEVYTHRFEGEEVRAWYEHQKTTNVFLDSHLEQAAYLVYYWYSLGPVALGISTYKPLSESEIELFKRFRNVFELAYRRFLDIRQALAQAREARIETALERVRAVAMAMHAPSDLSSLAEVIFTELKSLEFQALRNTEIIINQDEKESIISYYYSDYGVTGIIEVDYKANPTVKEWAEGMRKAEDAFVEVVIPAQEMDAWRTYRESIGYKTDPRLDQASTVFYYSYATGLGALSISSFQPVGPELLQILERFRNVFKLSYQRYADITLAEQQAREAEIQLALERVRARSLAMHHTSELQEVVNVLAQQLHHISLDINGGVFITINGEVDRDIPLWASGGATDYVQKVTVPWLDRPIISRLRDAIRKGNNFLEEIYSREEKMELFEHLFSSPPWDATSEERKKELLSRPGGYARSVAVSTYTSLAIINHFGKIFSDEENAILKRFAKVFEQSYTRFLDLQKAETQAREAQIEAALERVRSRSMGMQRSDELRDVIQVIFEQMIQFIPDIDGAGFNMDFRETNDFNIWHCDHGQTFPVKMHIPYFDHTHFQCYVEAKEKGLDFYTVRLTFDEKNLFFDHVFKYLPGIAPELKDMIYNSAGYALSNVMLKNIVLYIQNYAGIPYSDVDNATLMRFGKVFEQTYIRFNDLKQAEAQAREASIEAALEKVRSRTMAMQKSDELAEAAYVLFQQLNHLGVVHERINIGIVKEENHAIDFWITEQGGNQINTRFSGRIDEPTTLSKFYTGWKAGQKSMVVDLAGAELTSWLNYLKEDIGIPFDPAFLHDRRVQTVGFFSRGMLVVTSPEPLGEEAIHLLEKFAGVFDLTYTRFNDLLVAEALARQAELDLVKLKEEKKRTEEALAELKATQAQLVQSEKMASLGELTAGIAHEIQNPLNFVNNFSEVNRELLQDLNAELVARHYEEAEAIARDVMANEEKINHHGKRADAIVKGMLQHSRSAAGQKEETDINALAEEFLRLAFHGFRAKDNAFNARLKTDFDPAIGKINVIPQDIGRVLLNLYNNAFYAVSEKQKLSIEGYQPIVSARTKKVNGEVEISVADNGNGIPEEIKEKIFQPFFTTKPTGQGTGLGLSLSYDIIKTNQGRISIRNTPGAGAEFIISLPINT